MRAVPDKDLDDAFAVHADEALALARQTFPTPARLCGPTAEYGWGESVGADKDTVVVPLSKGWKGWAADLVMDHGQARELAEQLLDVTTAGDPS